MTNKILDVLDANDVTVSLESAAGLPREPIERIDLDRELLD